MTTPETPEDVAREIANTWIITYCNLSLGDIGLSAQLSLELMIASTLRARDERAAKIAETYPPVILQMWDRPGGPPGNGQRASNGADIAAAIRDRS